MNDFFKKYIKEIGLKESQRHQRTNFLKKYVA